MTLQGSRTFVGFGFGAIQAGLFLYEAYLSGNFGRLVVAEVIPEVVQAIRDTAGYYRCNIAFEDRVETVMVGPVEIYDPKESHDRRQLTSAIAEASELSTAVPSIDFYAGDGDSSLAAILASGLAQKCRGQGPPAVIYAAENHNQAAEILEEAVGHYWSRTDRQACSRQVLFINTVIGKMSGVVTESERIEKIDISCITPGIKRAFLVEAFNRILISGIHFPPGVPYERGIKVFEEKADLLPFEEAKLYGHNATHALGAYIGQLAGLETFGQLRGIPGVFPFIEAAFLNESGVALVRKNAGIDPLFTPQGYFDYAQDLLVRMTNPFLHDTIARVARSPERKLGWDDRLIGTIRLALQQGVHPGRFAFGAAAALVGLNPYLLTAHQPLPLLLDRLWQDASPDHREKGQVTGLIENGLAQLASWQSAGEPALEDWFATHQA